MKINKIIIAIAFLPLISIAQEAKSQNNPVPVVPVLTKMCKVRTIVSYYLFF
jgi:hypothetical protein